MESQSMEDPSTSKGHAFWMGSLIPQPTSLVVESCWKQCDEEDKWMEMAVKSLMKKLIEADGPIRELQQALSFPGAPSKCVTIPRTFDGRLQISSRKGLPHVTYCRVWRWRDLQSHYELISLPECQFAFYKKLREVCINPFHYDRVDALILPPVMVPKLNHRVPGNSLLPFQQLREPIASQDAARLTSSKLRPQNANLLEWQPRTHNLVYSKLIEEYQSTESQPPPQPMNYEEQQGWASIYYYELNHRVGEMFNCISTSVIVDGFTNPDENGERFCVGQLSNIHRNSTIENVRKHIGKGIRVNYVNGEVYVECLSSASIFVESTITNLTDKLDPSNVFKISSGNTLKVFDNSKFAQLLSESVYCSRESVYHLSAMCIIRIAFVKGFGGKYSRTDIESTPTWIEIHFHDPLKWLDRVLIAMEGSTDQVSSIS